MRILIAEDNRSNRISLTSFLNEMGMEVQIAENGMQALEMWESFAPQILITDLNMPHLDGVKLIEAIRSREVDSYTYIVVLTIDENLDTLEQSFEAGADEYLIKPFVKRELIQRIKAAERILRMFDNQLVVYALAQLTEARDFDTGTHIDRIGLYCKILAINLKNDPQYSFRITGRFVEDIAVSSALHDIGKVGISDAILHKPGLLTEEERSVMKKHTEIGSTIILSIERQYPKIKFLRSASEIARWHHEWFDGTGYPDGLKGEEIPLSARIVAVADVYDALRSERAYKAKMTHEQAVAILLKESGTHFDPHVIEAFMRTESLFNTSDLKSENMAGFGSLRK